MNEAAPYLERYRQGEWRATIFRDLILADAARRPGELTFLDIGCGRGFDDDLPLQQSLAARAGRYIGIEPDAAMAVGAHVSEVHRCLFEDAPIPSGSVDVAFARAGTELGGLDVLVNLAGGSLGTPRDLPDIGPEDYDRVLDVNLRGTFLCCQAAVPLLAPSGRGTIVNVSSIAARGTTPVTGVPYAAAKAGVLGLTRRLAREVGPLGIRVNAVAPGLFLSGPRLEGMWAGLSERERAEVLDAIPLRRLPGLAEAAAPILFLASDEASYVTGAVLDVNGGRYMGG